MRANSPAPQAAPLWLAVAGLTVRAVLGAGRGRAVPLQPQPDVFRMLPVLTGRWLLLGSLSPLLVLPAFFWLMRGLRGAGDAQTQHRFAGPVATTSTAMR